MDPPKVNQEMVVMVRKCATNASQVASNAISLFCVNCDEDMGSRLPWWHPKVSKALILLVPSTCKPWNIRKLAVTVFCNEARFHALMEPWLFLPISFSDTIYQLYATKVTKVLMEAMSFQKEASNPYWIVVTIEGPVSVKTLFEKFCVLWEEA